MKTTEETLKNILLPKDDNWDLADILHVSRRTVARDI